MEGTVYQVRSCICFVVSHTQTHNLPPTYYRKSLFARIHSIMISLSISHTSLSLMLNGKRTWPKELKQRYDELVNTFVNSTNRTGEKIVVPRKGLEPPLPLGKRILSPPRLPFRHLGIEKAEEVYHWLISTEVINL